MLAQPHWEVHTTVSDMSVSLVAGHRDRHPKQRAVPRSAARVVWLEARGNKIAPWLE